MASAQSTLSWCVIFGLKKNSQCTIMLLNILYIETFLNLPGDGNLLKALLHSIFGGICLYLSIYIAMRLHL